jgi:hypothetical protein
MLHSEYKNVKKVQKLDNHKWNTRPSECFIIDLAVLKSISAVREYSPLIASNRNLILRLDETKQADS